MSLLPVPSSTQAASWPATRENSGEQPRSQVVTGHSLHFTSRLFNLDYQWLRQEETPADMGPLTQAGRLLGDGLRVHEYGQLRSPEYYQALRRQQVAALLGPTTGGQVMGKVIYSPQTVPAGAYWTGFRGN